MSNPSPAATKSNKPTDPPPKLTARIVSFVVLCLAVGIGLIYNYQDNLLYFPQIPNRYVHQNEPGLRLPHEANMNYENVTVLTVDGFRLHSWLIKQDNPKDYPTIVFFHGRSGNIGHRIPFLSILTKYCQANVFIIDYRGYGYSDGLPSERGLLIDSLATLDYLFTRTDIDLSKVFVLGNSMGGAVAIHAAAYTSQKLAGVMVENTFTSIPDVMAVKVPFLKDILSKIAKNKWESIKVIDKVKAPMLFLSGLKDELVPPRHMQDLYKAAVKSEFKEMIEIPEGDHDESWKVGELAYFRGINDFMNKIVKA